MSIWSTRAAPGDIWASALFSNHADISPRALCVFAAVTLSACVIVPDQRHYAGGVVLVAPPPPREEIVGVAPVPGQVWLSGYWGWVAIAMSGCPVIGPPVVQGVTGFPINGSGRAMDGG